MSHWERQVEGNQSEGGGKGGGGKGRRPRKEKGRETGETVSPQVDAGPQISSNELIAEEAALRDGTDGPHVTGSLLTLHKSLRPFPFTFSHEGVGRHDPRGPTLQPKVSDLQPCP